MTEWKFFVSLQSRHSATYREIHQDDGHEEHEGAEQEADVKVKRSVVLAEDDVIQLILAQCHDDDVRDEAVPRLKYLLLAVRHTDLWLGNETIYCVRLSIERSWVRLSVKWLLLG